ncbi:MAG: hypothetical protein IPP49_13175 [Saprospiraceae bacterium]|nr:hypothetical protein [Saprospiraceae bacterium]
MKRLLIVLLYQILYRPTENTEYVVAVKASAVLNLLVLRLSAGSKKD